MFDSVPTVFLKILLRTITSDQVIGLNQVIKQLFKAKHIAQSKANGLAILPFAIVGGVYCKDPLALGVGMHPVRRQGSTDWMPIRILAILSQEGNE